VSVPSAANAAHILIKGQAIEFEIEQLIDTWRRDRPGDHAAFKAIVEQEHATMFHGDGMSQDKTMAYVGKIPTDVYIVLCRRYPEFMQSADNIRKVHRWCCGERLPKHKEKNFIIIDRRSK